MAVVETGPTLGEQIYGFIRDGIVHDRFKPGQLIIESKLAKEFNVSRTPVSNAVIMLKERGLIEELGGKFYVLNLSLEDVIELYQCRIALDSLATRLAAERITEEELEILASALDVWEQVTEMPETNALWIADLQFHATIYDASRNLHLHRFSETATDLLSTYRRVIVDNLSLSPDQQRTPGDVGNEHRAIYEALKARDAESAEAMARKHIENVIDFLNRVQSHHKPTRQKSLKTTH
jgi:DNA-binding GntR family transcriptional regulator